MSTTPVPAAPASTKRFRPLAFLASFRFWLALVLLLLVLLIAYHVASDRSAPLTSDAYAQAYVVQVAPRVEGEVVRVHVKENDTVRKGEPLFEIDPRPFEHQVARLKAKLASAVQQVIQMEADLAALKADDARLDAEVSYTDRIHDINDRSYQQNAVGEEVFLQSLREKLTAKAEKTRSLQLIRKAEAALAARIGSEHALVAGVRAELAEAELDLGFTRVVAPADGLVTNVQLRVGSHVKPGEAVLSCIDAGQWFIVADFRENCLERMAEGQDAQVCFDNYPGRLYRAKVFSVGGGVGQGQGDPSGRLPAVPSSSPWIRPSQRFQVRLVLDDADAPPLRVGMRATVSVYCTPDAAVAPVTRLVHRFLALLDYLL